MTQNRYTYFYNFPFVSVNNRKCDFEFLCFMNKMAFFFTLCKYNEIDFILKIFQNISENSIKLILFAIL